MKLLDLDMDYFMENIAIWLLNQQNETRESRILEEK